MSHCFCCAQLLDNHQIKYLQDTSDNIQTLCHSCPSLAIHVSKVIDDDTISIPDLIGVTPTVYEDRLCLWPTPNHGYLWIVQQGNPVHNIVIREKHVQDLTLWTLNQSHQLVVWSVASLAEWQTFRETWLTMIR